MLIKETIDTYKTFQGEQLYNTELEAPTSNEIESPINDTFISKTRLNTIDCEMSKLMAFII
jgi:hypothetical protein